MLTKKEQSSELIRKVLTPSIKKDAHNFIPYDKTGNLYQYREMNKYEKEYIENRIKDVRKEQLKLFKKWIKNHKDVFNNMDRFWYVQNAVGDILGWTVEYSEYVSSLQEKFDSRIRRVGCEYSEDYSCPICGEELLITCIHPLELYCTRCRENVELNELRFLHKPEKHLKGGKI